MKYLTVILLILWTIQSSSFYYPTSYEDSRSQFKDKVTQLKSKKFPDLRKISLRVPTSKEADLTIDGLYIPQQGDNQQRLLILTSGIHGVEGYTGAALQIEYLENVLTADLVKTMGILVIHSVNPYGFHFNRRVDENNVDLNRNFSATEQDFNRVSKPYQEFESFINPKYPLRSGFWNDLKLFVKSLVKLFTHGKKAITQIAVGGQYQNQKGIYFGGETPSINAQLLAQVFIDVGKPYDKILHVDLHTGYGERGRLHLLSTEQASRLNGFSKVFEGFRIDLSSDKDFYKTSGSFDQFTLQAFNDKEVVIPMTFEFGTLDSQTIMGGFFSLRNMIYENQGFHYGFVDNSSEIAAQSEFLEMFNPSEQSWRKQVIETGRKSLETVTKRFSKL